MTLIGSPTTIICNKTLWVNLSQGILKFTSRKPVVSCERLTESVNLRLKPLYFVRNQGAQQT